jgi:hypothetical protein
MCGNVTLMGRLHASENGALPARAERLLRSMLKVSQMRGAQSGGGAVQTGRGGQPRQVIQKLVNAKRGDLALRLTARLARAARRKRAFGGGYLAQCHVRYATSGLTTEREAHPFRFVEARERGARAVYGHSASARRPIETSITHNGDMDGLRFRGVRLPFPELGAFLERVLGAHNRWVGDSPQLAGAVELYVTRGVWLESLRLAFQLTVAPPPPDVRTLPLELEGHARLAAVRALFAVHPAPSLEKLRAWEAVIEHATGRPPEQSVAFPAFGSRPHREQLRALISPRLLALADPELPAERLAAFVRATIDAFFDNDLYVALRKLEPGLEGTFGCVVTSTLEPACFVALSRGQPLSLGFCRETATVCVVSERAALKVRDGSGSVAFHERLDLDLCRGEIARVSMADDGRIELMLYGVADGRERGADELTAEGRLVPLRDNPYVAALPADAPERTTADLEAVPGILDAVRRSFRDRSAPNARTANAFANALLARAAPRLLVIGITNDLWLAEQFVRNLTALFPRMRAEAKSSNQILLDGPRPPDPDTVVLAVSQSGQDFPTLGALVLSMQGRSAESVFVLTGELDSLMGHAVGQSYALDAPFGERIFSNLSGFRPSEAALATVSATQHTFVEILLALSARALDARRFGALPHGFELSPLELAALERRRDLAVERQVPDLTGPSRSGDGNAVLRGLTRQARRWGSHLLESALAFAALLTVLEANLVAKLGVLPSRGFSLVAAVAPEELTTLLGVLGAQLDVVFYAFLAPLVVWCLRAVSGRSLFHRQGPRELLIGDTPYAHRILWLLSRKLFGLSYGFASLKPYSADCQDELVLTHEPVRGTLALIGLPTARHAALANRRQAALMSVKQFAFSRSLAGAGAEIVTVSHGPRPGGASLGTHVALPEAPLEAQGPLVEQLAEGMFDSWERLLAMQVLLEGLARRVSRAFLFRFDRSRTKDQVFAPTTAAPVSAAHIYQLLSRSTERYERPADAELPFEVTHSDWRASAPRARTTVWRS